MSFSLCDHRPPFDLRLRRPQVEAMSALSLEGFSRLLDTHHELLELAVRRGTGIWSALGEEALEFRARYLLKSLTVLGPSDHPSCVVEVDPLPDQEMAVLMEEYPTAWDAELSLISQWPDLLDKVAGASDSGKGEPFWLLSSMRAARDSIVGGDVTSLSDEHWSLSAGFEGCEPLLGSRRTRCSRPMTQLCLIFARYEISRGARFRCEEAYFLAGESVLYWSEGEWAECECLPPSSGGDACLMTCGEEALDKLLVLIGAVAYESRRESWDVRLKRVQAAAHFLSDVVAICEAATSDVNKRSLIMTPEERRGLHNYSHRAAGLERTYSVRDKVLRVTYRVGGELSGQCTRAMAWEKITAIAPALLQHISSEMMSKYGKGPSPAHGGSDASLFATFLYSRLGDSVASDEHRRVYKAREPEIVSNGAGTSWNLPGSGIVFSSTRGVRVEDVRYSPRGPFDFPGEYVIALLPQMLVFLGVHRDAEVCRGLVSQVNDSLWSMLDPWTERIRSLVMAARQGRPDEALSGMRSRLNALGIAPHREAMIVREGLAILKHCRTAIAEGDSNDCYWHLIRSRVTPCSSQPKVNMDAGLPMDGLTLNRRGRSAWVDGISERFKATRLEEDRFVKQPREGGDGDVVPQGALRGRGVVLLTPGLYTGTLYLGIGTHSEETGLPYSLTGATAIGS